MPDLPLIIRDLVFFLLIALAVIMLTKRFAVPYTLGLVAVGLCLGSFHVTPELVLFVFLPPLLFEGAWSVISRSCEKTGGSSFFSPARACFSRWGSLRPPCLRCFTSIL